MSKREMGVGKKHYVCPDENDELWKLYKEVVSELDLDADLRDAKVELVKIYPNIGKTCVAKIVKAGKELKFFSGKDYIIEFSGEIWDNILPEVRKVVMTHELMHVAVKVDDSGEVEYGLIDHDVNDFHILLKKHGINWFSIMQEKLVSLYASDAKIKANDDPEKIREKEEKLRKKQEKIMHSIKL